MACAGSPVVVMGTVVLSAAAAVGVVEDAGVVVSANKRTFAGSEAPRLKHFTFTVKDTLISPLFVLQISVCGISPSTGEGQETRTLAELISNKGADIGTDIGVRSLDLSENVAKNNNSILFV